MLGVCLALVLLGGWSWSSESLRTQLSREGPLSATMGSGATWSTADPHSDRREVTFGAALLCTNLPGAEVVIDAVRYDVVGEPVSLETWYRLIPARDDRHEDPDDSAWSPYGTVHGVPPDFTSEDEPRGEVSRELDGPITHTCDSQGPDAAMVEVLTALVADQRGASARRMHIDYHVGWAHRTLVVDWEQAICGPEAGRRCGD